MDDFDDEEDLWEDGVEVVESMQCQRRFGSGGPNGTSAGMCQSHGQNICDFRLTLTQGNQHIIITIYFLDPS
jgi:hypothetical protein